MYCRKCGKQLPDGAAVCPSCGTAVAVAPVQTTSGESKFTGGALMNAAVWWVVGFVSAITLGFGYPAMLCWVERWKAEHTYLNGRQLAFDGKGGQLFGKFIVWSLLSLITVGIYLIFVSVKMRAWVAKHTHFADNGEIADENSKSGFDGKWYQALGVACLTGFVTLITVGFGYFWAHCYKERWYCKHTYIDGKPIYFDGTGMQYFGKRIVWMLLTLITLGIYLFWLKVNSIKWTVSHTHIGENPVA